MLSGRGCCCLRLRVNVAQLVTDIKDAEFARAIQSVQPAEWLRLQKFVFRDDLLSSLVGRLLLRYAVCQLSNVRWKDVQLDRTDKGKPYVASPPISYGLNVTHQGDYVLLATSCAEQVGVDVMKFEKPRRQQTVTEYIDFMAKQFSQRELDAMRSQPDDSEKLKLFYRFWCLKESVIKATGVGIHNDLSSLSFNVTEPIAIGQCSRSTQLDTNDGDRWLFEETMIDSQHCAAVCSAKAVNDECVGSGGGGLFEAVDIGELLRPAHTINLLPSCGRDEWGAFAARKTKPF